MLVFLKGLINLINIRHVATLSLWRVSVTGQYVRHFIAAAVSWHRTFSCEHHVPPVSTHMLLPAAGYVCGHGGGSMNAMNLQ